MTVRNVLVARVSYSNVTTAEFDGGGFRCYFNHIPMECPDSRLFPP